MEHEINTPAVRAEVAGAVARYERALTGNGIAVLDELLRDGGQPEATHAA